MSTLRDDITVPVRYLGSVSRFAAMASARRVWIDPDARFDKRDKATHRTVIADANGVISLTVPIVRPQSLTAARLADIRISPHDHWWNIHFTALASAYGRTPFFEFYADDFRRFYTDRWVGQTIVEYDAALDALLSRLLDIRAEIIYGPAPAGAAALADIPFTPRPYYQIRADRQGFIPDLSVVDLLFNLGPEATLHLDP